jgi:molybdopterin-guanine dinucleotide biosynthesis protein A
MFEQMDTLQPVILAGGDDSRMGYNKALASFEGTTLIETIYTLLDFIFDKSPMVVTTTRLFLRISTVSKTPCS